MSHSEKRTFILIAVALVILLAIVWYFFSSREKYGGLTKEELIERMESDPLPIETQTAIFEGVKEDVARLGKKK
ncbi:MAG: hypothetical protein AAB518_01945 [Patescibacteria group bacterium]